MGDFEFESELRHQMRRVEPSKGFADAVMERTQAGHRPGPRLEVRKQIARASNWPSFLLLAASLLVACGSALEAHHQQEVRQMQQAQQLAGQFNLAITLTAKTLHHIDENVSRAGTMPKRQP